MCSISSSSYWCGFWEEGCPHFSRSRCGRYNFARGSHSWWGWLLAHGCLESRWSCCLNLASIRTDSKGTCSMFFRWHFASAGPFECSRDCCHRCMGSSTGLHWARAWSFDRLSITSLCFVSLSLRMEPVEWIASHSTESYWYDQLSFLCLRCSSSWGCC